jgi:hypothetical protein
MDKIYVMRNSLLAEQDKNIKNKESQNTIMKA